MGFWQKTWLDVPGLNTVTAEWGNGNLVLRQGVALEQFPTLRCHRIDVAFFNAQGKVVCVKEIIMDPKETNEFTYEHSDTIVACLPNYRDFSFIKIILDEKSLSFFNDNLRLVTEPLTKGLILRSMYEGVRDARVKATTFIDVVCGFIPHENNNQVIDLAYGYIGAATHILPRAINAEYLSKLFTVTKAKLLAASDSQFVISLT